MGRNAWKERDERERNKRKGAYITKNNMKAERERD